MARIDHRRTPNTDLSFYVLDDLRFQQNREISDRNSFDLYRFDTLSEAVQKLGEIPSYMTPALGMQRGAGELDLIHRREGEFTLVTDYQNIPAWRNDLRVLDAVKEVSENLAIEWQFFHGPFDSSILIPLDQRDLTEGYLPDTYFWNKNLRVDLAESLVNCSPFRAINEVYVPGKGWIDYLSARDIADRFGYKDPHCLKVTRYNVTYALTGKPWSTGQADISPKDLELLLERWYLLEGSAFQAQKAEDRLCKALSECIYGYEEDEVSREAHLQALKEDLYQGNYEKLDRALREAPADTVLQQNKAYELRYRLAGLSGDERKPSLDETIGEAAGRKSPETASIKEPETER